MSFLYMHNGRLLMVVRIDAKKVSISEQIYRGIRNWSKICALLRCCFILCNIFSTLLKALWHPVENISHRCPPWEFNTDTSLISLRHKGGNEFWAVLGDFAYFVLRGQKCEPLSDRKTFFEPYFDICLINPLITSLVDWFWSISIDKNCVAGFKSKRNQILLWQFIPLHFVINGPIKSHITELIRDGISCVTLNWILPPSPMGLNILYLSSMLSALYKLDCGHDLLNFDKVAFIFLWNSCPLNILLIGYEVSLHLMKFF